MKLVTRESRFDKLSSDPLLKTCYLIAQDVVIMTSYQKNIELCFQLCVG